MMPCDLSYQSCYIQICYNLQLNFIGVTVEPERNYIHFPSSKHMFTPVPVGEKISPKQVYELYNGGAQPVRFNFDLAPLDILRQVCILF